MDEAPSKGVGARIARARREAGYTQAELAQQLGITTRSIQNYESGAIIPYRHLARIELLTQKRRGWLLDEDDTGAGAFSEVLETMRQEMVVMQKRLDELRESTAQSRARRESRARGR